LRALRQHVDGEESAALLPHELIGHPVERLVVETLRVVLTRKASYKGAGSSIVIPWAPASVDPVVKRNATSVSFWSAVRNPVADPWLGQHDARIFRVFFDLVAQLPHVDAQILRILSMRRTPHRR
jgi:hypothetical protein